MPQHSHAMGHVFRRLLQQILGFLHRISPNYFVSRNSKTNIIVIPVGTQRSHHHMLRQQSRPASLGQRNVNQPHNRAAQIEASQHVTRPNRQHRHPPPPPPPFPPQPPQPK